METHRVIKKGPQKVELKISLNPTANSFELFDTIVFFFTRYMRDSNLTGRGTTTLLISFL